MSDERLANAKALLSRLDDAGPPSNLDSAREPAAQRVGPKPADPSLEIGIASCCFVTDTPHTIETRAGRFMQGLSDRVNTCRESHR